jgi:hypothetical protein
MFDPWKTRPIQRIATFLTKMQLDVSSDKRLDSGTGCLLFLFFGFGFGVSSRRIIQSHQEGGASVQVGSDVYCTVVIW